MKKRQFMSNSFYHYADKYIKDTITENQILQNDVTQLFWEEMEEHIKNNEIIILNINAKTRLGKTTLAIAIAKQIHKLLVKHNKTSDNTFGINNIMRDQQELSQAIRKPELNNTVIVIDEWNDLEATGENVTAETALLDNFSKVQAARYIHRIWCSPKEISDNQADILIEVVAKEERTYTTHCRIYYRLFKGGIEYTQIIGHANFYVGEIIENWEKNVKQTFYKYPRTTEENQYIQEQAEKDWFVLYNIQKHAKMELITKEGIARPRILQYAKTIQEVVKELEPLTQFGNLLTLDVVRNFVKMYARKNKILLSTLGDELMAGEAMGILKLYRNYHQLSGKLLAIKKKKETGKISYIEYHEEYELLEKTRAKLGIAIKLQEAEYKKYEEIQQKYEKK